MVHPTVYLGVRITCALSSELKDGPVFAMLAVEERDELVDGVSICFSGPD